MAIVIAAPASGSGKTTVTLAILAALVRRGLQIQSFKVGPDYIDPMFHQAVTGLACRTLDPFLTSESYVCWCFAQHLQGKQGAVIEGVMGLFDGKTTLDSAQPVDFASTAHVARLLDLPIVLVIDTARMGRSVAALVYGLIHYDPRLHIAGVILNRVGSPRHEQILQESLESLLVPVLGSIPTTNSLTLPSRHLGLVPVEELGSFQTITDRLADLADRCLNWEMMMPLVQTDHHCSSSGSVISVPPSPDPIPLSSASPLQIGVAWDRAFNFYYPDNLDLLRHSGVELIRFSPLAEGFEPARSCQGLYLGGGFPEIYAAELSEIIQQTDVSLPPIYAECGGLMVLGRSLVDLDGIAHPMLGLLPLQTRMESRLTLGYRSAVVLRSTLTLREGQSVRGHEFHRSIAEPVPLRPIYRWDQTQEGWATDRIHASYLHLHWGAQPHILSRFLLRLVALSARNTDTEPIRSRNYPAS